jgi:hypothetical protein
MFKLRGVRRRVGLAGAAKDLGIVRIQMCVLEVPPKFLATSRATGAR